MGDPEQFDRNQWAAMEECVRIYLPHASVAGRSTLRGYQAQLCSARWARLPADCEARRIRLVAVVAAKIDRLLSPLAVSLLLVLSVFPVILLGVVVGLDRLDCFGWSVFEDFARTILPHLDFHGLAELAAYIRPGSGGPWQTVGADLAARRDLLLWDVAERGSELLGGPWPFLDDRPVCPTFVPG